MIEFNSYQKATDATAKYPESGTGSMMALAYVGLGLGEAGEVQGKIKKVIRDDSGVLTDDVRLAIAKEAGDLLWYVARLCTEIGYDLSEVAEMNIEKLFDRKARGVIGGSGDDR